MAILEVETFKLPEKIVDLVDEVVQPNFIGPPPRLDAKRLADVDVGLLQHPRPLSLRVDFPRLAQVHSEIETKAVIILHFFLRKGSSSRLKVGG
jgi:hypothetical protein